MRKTKREMWKPKKRNAETGIHKRSWPFFFCVRILFSLFGISHFGDLSN